MKNNKGSVLIIVLVTVALVSVIATMILTMTSLSYQIKATAEKTNKNFYNCETALDEIKAGIQADVANCYLEHYIEVQANSQVEDKIALFNTVYKIDILNRLKDPEATTKYNVDTIKSYITSGMLYNEDTGYGVKIADAPDNSIYQRTDGIVFKNLDVTFYNSADSSTRIVTDIYIKYPPVHFDALDDNPPIMQYALIADEGVEVENLSNKVVGSIYCGNNGTDEISLNIPGASVLSGKASLTLYNSVDAVINGDVNLGNQSELITAGYTGLWSRNIILDDSCTLDLDGETSLVNDILMSANSNVKIGGNYYGFGNPANFTASQYLVDNNITAGSSVNKPKSEHTSAMLINGKSVSLDLEEVEYLMLGGTAYIGTYANGNTSNINPLMMGESIGVKGNQLAYLVPGRYLKNCSNPISEQEYIAKNGDCVTLSSSEYETIYYSLPGDYRMVYFFMKFDTTDEAAAYFKDYYSTNSGYINSLMDGYDANIKLPLEGTVELNSAGNIIEFTSSDRAITDNQVSTDALSLMAFKEDVYGTLCRTLKKSYEDIEPGQKSLTVFENVVDYQELRGVFTGKYSSDPLRIYETDTTMTNEIFKAIVVNDYLVDKIILKGGLANNEYGYEFSGGVLTVYPSQLNLRMVVTATETEIDGCNYHGLIISDGLATIKNGSILTHEPTDIAIAMFALNEDDEKISEVFVNGERYLIGGSGNEESIFSGIVTFANWNKE